MQHVLWQGHQSRRQKLSRQKQKQHRHFKVDHETTPDRWPQVRPADIHPSHILRPIESVEVAGGPGPLRHPRVEQNRHARPVRAPDQLLRQQTLRVLQGQQQHRGRQRVQVDLQQVDGLPAGQNPVQH